MSDSDPAALRLSLKLYLAQSMLESVVYGCYMITFGMAMFVMTQRKGANAASRWDFWALVLLFLIATLVTLTDLIANASILYKTFGLGGLRPDTPPAEIHHFNLTMQMVAEMGFVFANILADCVLIRRCYVVWNSSWKVVIVPIILSVVNNSVGFSAVVILINVFFDTSISLDKGTSLLNSANSMLSAFFAINIVSNVILTGLIAGRIWWIMRALAKMTAEADISAVNAPVMRIRERYRSTIAIIIESGLLYPVSVIVFEIILKTVPLAPSLYPLMTTLAGMAPTLIIVRVQLGVSINTLNESANVLRLSGIGGRGTRSTAHSTSGLGSSVAEHSNSSRHFVDKDEDRESSIAIVSPQ